MCQQPLALIEPHSPQLLPLAVIEAKDNNHTVGAGMQQALAYAEIPMSPSPTAPTATPGPREIRPAAAGHSLSSSSVSKPSVRPPGAIAARSDRAGAREGS